MIILKIALFCTTLFQHASVKYKLLIYIWISPENKHNFKTLTEAEEFWLFFNIHCLQKDIDLYLLSLTGIANTCIVTQKLLFLL